MRPNNLIRYFTEHKVACNIIMLVMLIIGFYALTKLNSQFLPNFKLDIVTVQVIWPGANAQDIETAITIPLEQELTSINHVKEMTSTSREGGATISLEFFKGTDIGQAIEDVKQQVALVRNLPIDSEPPTISKVERLENIATLILYGPDNLERLRPLAQDIKRELLAAGIAKININGLPDKEIAIPFSSQALLEINQSLPILANQIAQESQTLPGGTVGESEWAHTIKSPGKSDRPYAFSQLSIQANNQLRMPVTQFAQPILRAQRNETKVFYQGKPAVELRLLRTEGADSLHSANILNSWLDDNQHQFGKSVQIVVFDEAWRPIFDRIALLIKNGFGGLLLILVTLFLFLERRIAFWVAVGIPVSFSAALALLFLFGGSINMVSLFAFIMTLGIIVDDTIVVGENAYTRIQNNRPPNLAAYEAAKRMIFPVIASSLTTVAAFLPLMLIGGIIGTILFDIPLVAICVIIVSLLECFLVLPGHIAKSFNKKSSHQSFAWLEKCRITFDHRFSHFRDTQFTKLIGWCVTNRGTTFSVAIAIVLVVFAFPMTGRLKFQFFPTPDSGIIQAHIQFVDGTPGRQVEAFLNEVESGLQQALIAFGHNEDNSLLVGKVAYLNEGVALNRSSQTGENLASLKIELISPDQRAFSNAAFIDKWKSFLTIPAGLEKLNIFSRRGGPPGKDIDIDLIGQDAATLKSASLVLQQTLASFDGVFNIEDNMPYGKPELVYELTPQAKSLNVTVESLGQQLRAAFDGIILQIVNDQNDEIEVRAILAESERATLASLQYFPILTPQGRLVPLNTIATFHERKGLGVLRHTDGLLTNRISAELDTTQVVADEVLAYLKENTLPEILNDYGVHYALKGRSEDQAQTLNDMGKGVLLATVLIYFILAWIFASYAKPFVIMAVLPFGITGAIFGHLLMGIDMTILSLFGFFGLSGIVVNDSIILVSFYQNLIKSGMKMQVAIVEAVRSRLRAVILTSLTTIAGLLPLLFETSVQAQFLIPMAVSISFGLFFTTFLVLFVVPVLLYWEEKLQVSIRWRHRKSARKVRANAALSAPSS